MYGAIYALGLFQEADSYASHVWLILNIKVNEKSIELVMSIMDCLLITKKIETEGVLTGYSSTLLHHQLSIKTKHALYIMESYYLSLMCFFNRTIPIKLHTCTHTHPCIRIH